MMQTNGSAPSNLTPLGESIGNSDLEEAGQADLEKAFLRNPAKRSRTSGALSGSVTPESKSPLKPSRRPLPCIGGSATFLSPCYS